MNKKEIRRNYLMDFFLICRLFLLCAHYSINKFNFLNYSNCSYLLHDMTTIVIGVFFLYKKQHSIKTYFYQLSFIYKLAVLYDLIPSYLLMCVHP